MTRETCLPITCLQLTAPHLTWAQLMRLTSGMAAGGTTPWCMGLEDSSSSGWPGTDWIEDILLHRSGPQVYDQWVAGTLPWTSPLVVRAWQVFGQIANTPGQVRGGTEAELLTSYGQAGQPLFGSPPGCYLDHEASFITAFYTVSSSAFPVPARIPGRGRTSSRTSASPRWQPRARAPRRSPATCSDVPSYHRRARADRVPDNAAGPGSVDPPGAAGRSP